MSATTTTTYTRPDKVKIPNREAWLHKAAEHLWGDIIAAGGERPKRLRISCGWPSKKALMTASSASRVLGQAFHAAASDDKAREVFITPALAEECRVLDVLLHELIHTALPPDAGHGPAFQAIMRKVGLAGKPTATVASDELLAELQVLAHELGRYPHEVLDVAPGVKKPGRMVKGECPECGNILYGSRQAWEILPSCGYCDVPYVVMPSDEQVAHWGMRPSEYAEKLVNVSTTVELKTKDGRFTLRSTKSGGQDGAWMVTDHEAIERTRRIASVKVMGSDQEEAIEVTEYDARWCYRPSREDALAFIGAIRSGELEWDDIDEELEDFEDELDGEELEDVLGPVGEWEPDEDYLDDDEDEEPDYDDGTFEDPEEEASFLAEADKRDASGARKSAAIIAAGGEGALD